ncbi:hypothetical protein C8R45DRAFT_934756 [Mycena sanguinolenta]|nr:hypothetical protein C8R45DRAFT_934756 [Mycena sanguinolenta]
MKLFSSVSLLKEFKLAPKSKAKITDHLMPHLLGYALQGRPLQCTKNTAQLKKLLHNTAPKHVIAITIDPAFVELSFCKSLSGPETPHIHTVRNTWIHVDQKIDGLSDMFASEASTAACNSDMHLQARMHQAMRSCFGTIIGIHQRLTRAEEKAGEKELMPDDAENLKAAKLKLRTEEANLNEEQYYTLILYLNTNNNLPSLPDHDKDKFNTVCQALGYMASDSAIHIWQWAANQWPFNDWFPDTIKWFAKLHKIAAFHIIGIKPADLLETKKVSWGKTAFKTYSKAIITQVDGWVATDLLINGTKPLMKEEQQIMSLLKQKLQLVFKYSLITDNHPLLLSFYLAASAADHTSPERATSTHIVPSAIVLDSHTLSVGWHLKEACLEDLFFPVWPELKNLPEAVNEDYNWADDVLKLPNKDWMKKYLASMGIEDFHWWYEGVQDNKNMTNTLLLLVNTLHLLEGLGLGLHEIIKDDQASHIGLADFDLANDLVCIDHKNASKAAFPGFPPTIFTLIADTVVFFTASNIQYLEL